MIKNREWVGTAFQVVSKHHQTKDRSGAAPRRHTSARQGARGRSGQDAAHPAPADGPTRAVRAGVGSARRRCCAGHGAAIHSPSFSHPGPLAGARPVPNGPAAMPPPGRPGPPQRRTPCRHRPVPLQSCSPESSADTLPESRRQAPVGCLTRRHAPVSLVSEGRSDRTADCVHTHSLF